MFWNFEEPPPLTTVLESFGVLEVRTYRLGKLELAIEGVSKLKRLSSALNGLPGLV